jgi:serine beta-lactamase-like protein LACTB, mitochondrial
MRWLLGSLLIVAPISGAALFAVEQETAVAQSATTQLEELRKTTGAPALQAAVIVNGRIGWSGAVGTANLEHAVPATAATRFRIGSVSKLITVTAAMRLHQDGALDLDAPIQRYVPVFPDKGHPITARQLAGHLAGVRHYGQNDYVNRVRYDSVTGSLASFSADPLRFEPGTQYLYSTFGYTLLSAAIEGASKLPYESYIQRAVLDPAGMSRTLLDRATPITPARAGCYERAADGGLENGSYIDLSDRWAAGGFLSTAEDLVRFADASMAARLVSSQELDLMLTSMVTADGKATGVGFGWRVVMNGGALEYAHHGGESIGGRAFLLMIPRKRAAIAVLANLGRARFAEKEALALLTPFLN